MKVLEAFGEPVADGGQEAFVFGILQKMDRAGLDVDFLTAYDWRSDHYRKLSKELGGSAYSLKLPFIPGRSRSNIKNCGIYSKHNGGNWCNCWINWCDFWLEDSSARIIYSYKISSFHSTCGSNSFCYNISHQS